MIHFPRGNAARMSAVPGKARGGFSLIEVLIVVVIMAILASVLIPFVPSMTQDARTSALKHNLAVLQAQVQLYRSYHLGQLPTIQEQSLPQLTRATNVNGETGVLGPAYPLEPHVDRIPPNPFDNSEKVSEVAKAGVPPSGVAGALGGWQYDPSNGSIWPNNPEYYAK